MILTLTIAVTLYIFCLVSIRSVVTPDGEYYLAMGRGAHVPRPYALRSIAQLLPNIMSWRVLHAVSYLWLAIMSHTFAEMHGADGTAVAIGVLCLPTLRQSVGWPVLLDVPMLAYIATAAVYGSESTLVACIMIGLAPIIHERAAIWSALYLCTSVHPVFIVASLLVSGMMYAQLYFMQQSHHDEHSIDWLRNPIKAALAKHIPTLNDWRVWVLPWGASIIGLAWDNVLVYAAMIVGYAGCIAAQDRARIYAPAALLLTTGAVLVAGDFAIAIPIVNYFIHIREV